MQRLLTGERTIFSTNGAMKTGFPHTGDVAKCKSPGFNLQYNDKKIATTKSMENNKCWMGCGETGSFVHCWWECKIPQLLEKTVWQFLKRFDLPCDPAILLQDLCTKELKAGSEADTCKPACIATFSTISKGRKQHKCPHMDEWGTKVWCAHTCILKGRKLWHSLDHGWTWRHYAQWTKPAIEGQTQCYLGSLT